jgi:succinate-semialdehyde dehydrogenase/glutarate-semialdehyde dehydrogenase
MARTGLRDELDAQVEDAVEHGARVLTGGRPLEGPGAFYAPTVLDGVTPGMRAWSEELFGPVASVIRVEDAEHALVIANGSPFGLGGSVWTQDLERGAALARRLECGAACDGEGRRLRRRWSRFGTRITTGE